MIQTRIIVAGALLLATTSWAQTGPGAPRLLADLGQAPNIGSAPAQFTPFRGVCYFTAAGASGIPTIHRYDGRPGTAVSVIDPQPRPAGSIPSLLTPVRSTLFFVTGTKLWASDGTAAGTVAAASLPTPAVALGAVDDRLIALTSGGIFSTRAGLPGFVSLLSTSGSVRAPALVASRQPAPGGGGEQAFFTTTTVGDQSLWVTDGTTNGTRRVGSLPFGAIVRTSDAASIGPGRLVFATIQTGNDVTLWFADTVAGTVAPIGPAGAQARDVVRQRGRAVAVATASPGVLAFAYDGTTRIDIVSAAADRPSLLGVIQDAIWLHNGADQLLRLDPGASQAVPAGRAPRPQFGVAEIGGRFVYVDAATGDFVEVDPATGVTRTLVASEPTNRQIAAMPALGEVVFDASVAGLGREPWSYSAASRNASLIADLGPSQRGDSNPTNFTRFGDRVVFETRDLVAQRRALWITDGTEARTRPLPLPTSLAVDGALQIVAADDRLWVIEGSRPARILFTDGTIAGSGVAAVVADPPGRAHAFGSELLLADGTVIGPSSRRSLPVGGQVLGVVPTGDSAWLVIANPNRGLDIALTDPSGGGYRVVGQAGSPSAAVLGALRFGGRLWVSTTEATFVADTRGVTAVPQVPGSHLVDIGDVLSAFPLAGGEILLVDPSGSVLGRLPVFGARGREATALGDRALFLADGQAWVTNGTARGTAQLTAPGALRGVVDTIRVTGPDQALFTFQELGRYSILVSDGTLAGTRAIATELDIDRSWLRFPGPLVANGQAYWSIRTPQNGNEPHVIDLGAAVETIGTACGGDPLSGASLRAGSRPILGSRVTLEARARGARFATLLFGAPALRPTSLPGIGCAVHVDAATLTATPVVATDASGALRATLGIPSDPALIGADLSIQAVLAASLTGLRQELSPALRLSLGE